MRPLVIVCFMVASCAEADRQVVEPDGATPAHDDFDSRTIALGGGVQEFNYMPNSAVTVAGVRVCQHEPRRCTETSEFGGWLLDGLKPEREILLTYEKAGFLPLLSAHRHSEVLERADAGVHHTVRERCRSRARHTVRRSAQR